MACLAAVCAGPATADQASQPSTLVAGRIATGKYHTCAILGDGSVRCWGYGGDGALGYGNTSNVGDDETPASAGTVNLGPGRTARAISAGDYHTCALLDDGSVRCWGFGADGRLGYGNTNSVGASQTPAAVGPVDLGPGRTAVAISAGGGHTCALLDDGSVRCWGFALNGELGYGNTNSVGDTPADTPGMAGPVDVGAGRTARAISAGWRHTCALLDDGSVRCWGNGGSGRLGYGNHNNVGDHQTPDTAGPVNLGPARTAVALSAGGAHTCAILDDGTVRCWGFDASGQLGYGNTNDVGDTPASTPDKLGPVNLGPGRTATAISAGFAHTCAVLDDGSVRCWGDGADGQLGYGSTNNVGDTPVATPARVGPVNLGRGRTAVAISAGDLHTCALLDDDTVRCWGDGAYGRLGYCAVSNVGDTPATLPGNVGPVKLGPGNLGAGCAGPQAGANADPLRTQALRARGLRACVARASGLTKRRRSAARTDCLKRYGRRPGRVSRLHGRAISPTKVALTFAASGTDAGRPPPARSYLIAQSPAPIRTARELGRAQALCKGRCRFSVTGVGQRISLTVTGLRPHTRYYYAVVARDNVSGELGPRSVTVTVKTP
ncbi:MAG: hypothetical protein ACR2LV_08555 [Solirubrobacteraceae bacterium]